MVVRNFVAQRMSKLVLNPLDKQSTQNSEHSWQSRANTYLSYIRSGLLWLSFARKAVTVHHRHFCVNPAQIPAAYISGRQYAAECAEEQDGGIRQVHHKLRHARPRRNSRWRRRARLST